MSLKLTLLTRFYFNMKNNIDFLNTNPFILNEDEKNKIFYKRINYLTKFHYKKSPIYKKILINLGYKNEKNYPIANLPFIPARLFKEIELKSIKKKDIFKVLRSSGTTGNKTSKIFLDKNNASNQRIVLSKIFTSFVAKNRMPMLIIGQNPIFNRFNFNAKTAAILGFSLFGSNHEYLFNKSNELDEKVLFNFLKKYKNQKFLIFGFTSDIYSTFFYHLAKIKKINLENAVLIHGGGWKKLESKKISNSVFKKKLLTNYNIQTVINYYGLIEQVGSIFFECPICNVFICSDFSDILIRDQNFNIKNKGKGIVQLISLIPTSYPGHNILTEDIGEVLGYDYCKCGIKGKAFRIHGRIANSEIRGCSNV